jgi:hypothetical protein
MTKSHKIIITRLHNKRGGGSGARIVLLNYDKQLLLLYATVMNILRSDISVPSTLQYN